MKRAKLCDAAFQKIKSRGEARESKKKKNGAKGHQRRCTGVIKRSILVFLMRFLMCSGVLSAPASAL